MSKKVFDIEFDNLLIWFGLAVLMIIVTVIYTRIPESPDATHLVEMARNLSHGKGLVTFDLTLHSKSVPDKVLLWPPLYPFILSILMRAGLNTLWSVRLVIVISYLISVISLVYICRKLVDSRNFSLIVLIIWIVLTPSLLVYNYAWSEPLFIAIVAGFICLFSYVTEEDRSIIFYFVLGLLGGTAFICRYIGIVLAFSGGVSLLILFIMRREISFLNSIKILAYTSGGILVAAPLIWHNYILTGHLTGLPRPPSNFDYKENILFLLETIGKNLAIPLGIGFVILLIIPNLKISFKDVKAVLDFKKKPIVLILIVWFVCYSIVLIIIESIIHIDQISTRYVMPIYIALIPFILYPPVYFLVRNVGKFSASGFALKIAFCVVFLEIILVGRVQSNLLAMNEGSNDGVYQWVKKNTTQKALIIGDGAWLVRYYTGRVVLESGYPSMPKLRPLAIVKFIEEFGSKFSQYYLIDLYGRINKKKENAVFKRRGLELVEEFSDANSSIYELESLPKK